MKKAVLGLIGAGYLANAQHLPNLMFTRNAKLKTVCDVNEEAARTAQKKYNIPQIETDSNRLFADPEIDGVVIVTREDMHAPLAIAAMEAGKHVYVEKPLADTRTNCEKIVEAQERTGKILAVGFNRRCSPAIAKAKEIVYAHGGPSNIYFRMADSYHYTWGKNYPPGVRVFHETCHIFDLFRWFCESEPDTIYCVDSRADDEIVTLKMKSGCVCTILCSGYASIDTPKESMEVIADGGMVVMDHHVELRTYGFPECEDVYRFKGHAHPDLDIIYRWVFEELGAAGARAFHKHWTRLVWHPERLTKGDATEDAIVKRFRDTHYHATGYHVDKGWLQAMEHFADCILTGKKCELSDAKGGLIAELMGEAAVRSRKSGVPERVQ